MNETPDTLYRDAAMASQAGDKVKALTLLERAAQKGHADAGFTLMSFVLQGIGCKADAERAALWCRRSADAGSTAAGLAMALFEARGLGMAADWQAAIGRLCTLAKHGSAPAQRQLGMLLSMDGARDAADDRQNLAGRLMWHAAHGGDLMAALILARKGAMGAADICSLPVARTLFDKVAAAKHPVVYWLSKDLGDGERASLPPADGRPDMEQVAALLAEPPVPSFAEAERLSDDPDVVRRPGFLSVPECDYLIGMAAPRLAASQIFDPTTGERRPDPYRTSFTASLYPLDQDLVTYAIDLRMAHATGIAVQNGEMLSVLAYAPGQEYKPHFDTLSDDKGAGSAEISRSGQRVATFLVALNDWYEGGETAFPRAGIKVRLSVGDGLFFRNTLADGSPDPQSLHAGLPVTRGMKWLASKWLRERTYRWP